MTRQVIINAGWEPNDASVDYEGSPTPYELVELYGYDWQEELGEGSYPIWDESMRKWLNEQIYNNFLYRNIGQETGTDFFRWMRIKLNQIMPILNPVAKFALGLTEESRDWRLVAEIVTESGNTFNGTTTADGTGTVTNSGENVTTTVADTSSKASNLTSTTPQTQLSGAENYMTGLVENGSEGNSSGTETARLGTSSKDVSNSVSTFDQTNATNSDEKHYEGLGAELARRWADAAPDILGNIYAGLESLFVQVW